MEDCKQWILRRQMYLFPVLDIILNGINYFFHIITSWYLVSSEYGAFNALLAVLTILMVSGISFQTCVANIVSASETKEQQVRLKMMTMGAVYTLSIALVLIIFRQGAIGITRGSTLSVFLVLLIFIVNVFLSIQRGVMQGKKHFVKLNASFYIEVLSKLGFLVLVLPIVSSKEVGLAAILVGMCASLLHSLLVEPYKIELFQGKTAYAISDAQKSEWTQLAMSLGTIFIANFFLYFFTSVDILFINYYLPESSGNYAVIIRYSQLIFFAGASCQAVFLPYLSKARENMPQFRIYLKWQIILLSVLGVGALVGYKWILPPTVGLLFGDQYAAISNLMIYGALVYICLLFSYQMVNVFIVLNEKKYIVDLLVAGLFQVVALTVFRQSIISILLSECVIFLLLFIKLFFRVRQKVTQLDQAVAEVFE